MTREDIDQAFDGIFTFHPLSAPDRAWKDKIVEFARDIVQQAYEELALSWETKHGYDKFHVGQFIREAKP